MIIGPPGSGKTTLLKHITILLAANRKTPYQAFLANMPHKLPILLFLRDHASKIKERPDLSLVEAIQDHLKKWKQPDPPEGWFERQLVRGRCLIMLDGLDEVANLKVRQRVVNWVERQMSAYHGNRFLVTSRPFGYSSNPLSGVTLLEVRPFTTSQVENFIHRWYLANEMMSKQKNDAGVQMKARAEADAFLQQLRNTPALFDLTVNPLLLTMIATVHRYGGELPGNRVALYAEICEVFLGKRQQARGQVIELTPSQMQLVLEPLAYHMMIKGVREIMLGETQRVIEKPLSQVSSQMSAESFLQLVENASGLLIERENGIYSFAHLTFQEYLTAVFLVERRWGNWLLEHIGSTWWQETIRLYCALTDATQIITACLKEDRPSVSIVELAINCDEEAREVHPAVRNRLDMMLKQGVEDSEPERQHIYAEALLKKRLRRMVHLKDETYSDTSFITCAEYQVFLDEQRARGRQLQPDHWTSYHFPAGHGNTPVIGVRSSDALAFCEWLTEREQSPWIYRLPEAGELEDEKIMPKLPANTCYWLNDGKGVTWIKEPLILPEDVRQKSRIPDNRGILTASIDLSSDLTLAHSLDQELGDKLDNLCNRDYARTRTRIFDYCYELTSEIASELNQVDKYSPKVTVQLADIRDLISQLANQLATARDLSSAIDIDISRSQELTTIFNHVYGLDRALARELARVRKVLIASERDSARSINRYSRLRDQAQLQAISNIYHSARIVGGIIDSARNIELNIFSNLERAQEFTLDRENRENEILQILDHTFRLTESWEKPPSRKGLWQFFRFGQQRVELKNRTDDFIEGVFDIYAHLVILNERIHGKLPACESILIIKERDK